LSESDLDTAYQQSLFVAQEVAEDADPEGGSGIGNIVNSQLAGISITADKLAGGITQDKLAGGITSAQLAGSIADSKLASGVGTSANNLVKLDGTAKLPAVDGSQLTGITPQASLAAYKWGALDQNNANTTIPSSSIMVNVGSDLATSGVYTCPVDGVYRATIWGMAGADGSNSESSIFNSYLSLNDAFPTDDQYHIYVSPATSYSQFSANFLITCSASDTLRWGIQANRRTLHSAHGQATFKLEHAS
jgi:hypothetical protein